MHPQPIDAQILCRLVGAVAKAVWSLCIHNDLDASKDELELKRVAKAVWSLCIHNEVATHPGTLEARVAKAVWSLCIHNISLMCLSRKASLR